MEGPLPPEPTPEADSVINSVTESWASDYPTDGMVQDVREGVKLMTITNQDIRWSVTPALGETIEQRPQRAHNANYAHTCIEIFH